MASKGSKQPDKVKNKISAKLKGHLVSEKTRRKISKKLLGRKGRIWSEEQRIKQKEISKKIWENMNIDKKQKALEKLRRMSLLNSQRLVSDKTRKQMSKSSMGNKNFLGRNLEKTRLKHSLIMKRKWQDLVYRETQLKKILSNNSKKYNKQERELDLFLQKLLPSEYKYVGDGQLILGSKNPDFCNINRKKKLIEMFGDYWHKNDNSQDRINYFKEYNYDTLVVWGSELKNVERLSERVLTFQNV